MKDIQKEVDDWVGQYVEGYWNPMEIVVRLTEEVGELAREVNHRFGPKKKKDEEDNKEIGDEIGDIIFTLTCLANSQGIDLDEAMERVVDKLYKRDDNRFEKK